MTDNKQNNSDKISLIWWGWGAFTVAVPLLLALVLWDKLPAQIPVHWNINGKPDSYEFKGTALVWLIGTNVLLYLLLWLVPKLDTKGNFAKFRTTYRWITLSLGTFIALITCIILIHSAGFDFNLLRVIFTLILLMLAVLGNFMGKLRPNYFVGIRTPWTLKNEDIWMKTHRMGGQLWVITGLLALVIVQVFNTPGWVVMSAILIMVLVPVVYSYLLYKKMSEQ